MSDGPRHRTAPPDPARLTPPPEPEAGIRGTDNSGDPDLPELSQDPAYRPDPVAEEALR